jgi:hypothetical protein
MPLWIWLALAYLIGSFFPFSRLTGKLKSL